MISSPNFYWVHGFLKTISLLWNERNDCKETLIMQHYNTNHRLNHDVIFLAIVTKLVVVVVH